jgi:hypothetical protein
MKDLTVIIPVDKNTEEVQTLLNKAYDSIPKDSECIVIGPQGIELPSGGAKITFLANTDTNLPTQVNKAVEQVKTTFFSVLEYDDFYTPNWFKNVETRIESNPEVFGYLPICEGFEFGDDAHVVGYINEPVWASSFSQRLGYFDIESLNTYPEANCTGGVFRTADFIDLGGLKESMKVSFWYEFLLRAIHKAKEIFVIPKVGYKHCYGRPGSLSEIYRETLSNEEAQWWLELAKQEYFFKKDRKKTYEE